MTSPEDHAMFAAHFPEAARRMAAWEELNARVEAASGPERAWLGLELELRRPGLLAAMEAASAQLATGRVPHVQGCTGCRPGRRHHRGRHPRR